MSLSKSVKRWAFYNFANHSYQLVYVAFLLPVLFSTVLLTKGYSLSAWGIANAISTVLGVTVAVIIGRYSDTHSKLRAFQWSILLAFVGMVAISASAAYLPTSLYWIFIITNAVFIWSVALSDSILPHVSDYQTVYEYGGFAWGFGYLGAIASLAIALLLQYLTGTYSFWVFLSVPTFYLVFSWYALAGLQEVPFREPSPIRKRSLLSPTERGTLFLGYWLISECITVVSLFASIYLARELHFSILQVGLTFLVVDLIAFPTTWWGGKLVSSYGSLRLLGWTIVLWGITILMLTALHLNLLGLAIMIAFIGLAYGNSLRLVERPNYEMIEFFDPDFDVLAYVVSYPPSCMYKR